MSRPTAVAQAFEDYWTLGPDRSLTKLWTKYLADKAEGKPIPTRHLCTLKEWSARERWQSRIADRIHEDGEKARNAARERALRVRMDMLAGLDEGGRRFLERMRSGDVNLISDMGDLQQFAKLFFALAGEPLVDRTEVTGAGGAPLQVEHSGQVDFTADPNLASLAASCVAAMVAGDPEPCGLGDAPDEGSLEAGEAPRED